MAEYQQASVAPNSIEDDDLWLDVGEDPTLYVRALRGQGRIAPRFDSVIEVKVPGVVPTLPTSTGNTL